MEAGHVLQSLQANCVPEDIDELKQLVVSSSSFLDRAALSLAQVTHREAETSKASTRLILAAIQARIEDLRPTLPEPVPETSPIRLDISSHNHSTLSALDTIAQIMILLGVVCHWIVGLSTEPCEFIIGVTTMLIKMAMTAHARQPPSDYTSSQRIVLEQLPTSLYTATNRFQLDGQTTTYAVCPTCSYTHPPVQDRVTLHTKYPVRCSNQLVTASGLVLCNARLLESDNATSAPLKPFVMQSFRHYLSNLLSDGEIENICDQSCDDALEWQREGTHPCENEVFRGDFFRTFKGPHSQHLFLKRNGRMRLAFIMHVDFFNPNGTTKRGNHDSIGIISLALLNLPKRLRDKPENVFVAGIIPGPKEPPLDQLNHFIRPIIDEFEIGWQRGFHLPHTTASPEHGRLLDVALVISTNDLPCARKVSGTAGGTSNFICTVCNQVGRHNIQGVDYERWKHRDPSAMRSQAEAWRDACTTQEQDEIFENYGIRWSELWRLPYWDPTRMLVIDAMHCILEGLVHYHCRHVLHLKSHSEPRQEKQQGPAFVYPWMAYDPACTSQAERLKNVKEEIQVGLIQHDLSLSMDNTHESISSLKRKLSTRNKAPLHFVWKSLNLPSELTQRDSNGKNHVVSAKKKEHYIELLVGWVSHKFNQPHRSSIFPSV